MSNNSMTILVKRTTWNSKKMCSEVSVIYLDSSIVANVEDYFRQRGNKRFSWILLHAPKIRYR